jgi:hypothetical protein
MKKLILKWLGLDNVLRFDDSDFIDDCVTSLLARSYDLEGLVSKFEDLQGNFEDGEYRWDNTADVVESIVDVDELIYKDDIQELKDKMADFQDAINTVEAIDDRLTEMIAGYVLEVNLVKDDYLREDFR